MLRDKSISVRLSKPLLAELKKEQKEFGYKTLGRYVFGLLASRSPVVTRQREVRKQMSEL